MNIFLLTFPNSMKSKKQDKFILSINAKSCKMTRIRTDLNGLNNKQRQAVTSDCKRLLVLTGAGSGKTKTLLQKLIYLIGEKGINPSNILAISFTKNAANEMLNRLTISADDTKKYAENLSNEHLKPKEKIRSDIFSPKSTNG